MKRTITWVLMAFLLLSTDTSIAQQKTTTMTTQERDYAIRFLKETETDVLNSVKGLSEAQLKFKPAANKWSAEECIKHIAAAEKELWAMAVPVLKQPANPEKRTDIKFTDEQLVKAVEDRSHQSKTITALEPDNSPYKSVAEALNAFKKNRDKLIVFINSTQENLRNHVVVLPVGTYDLYQFILLISAHSNRHTQQIEEVKVNNSFPQY
ncbi:DUF664 domain-containing protein [Chitinophaga oryziterrae]|uniref:DUF664 domain-containing protein n=1 Tax=Chitinophaga oryziterrae TaxID=1031224 RepID=A0A6N8JEQ2_9BACT|nr:DinB family protein [Chitinophaga oryziterrae]MVT43444.1 DUF664 domain-containing protein [Chitinophaga oryziterrae]